MLEECPRCGCPELEVIQQRRVLGWDHVRWQCGNCGKVGNSARRYLEAAEPEPSKGPTPIEVPGVRYEFVRARSICPDCALPGTVYCTRRAKRIRYLRCENGHGWKQVAEKLVQAP